MGELSPLEPEIPIVFFFQPIVTKYLEKCIVVEDVDICSVCHVEQLVLVAQTLVKRELLGAVRTLAQTQLNMSNFDVLNSRVLPLFAIERPSQVSLSDAKDMAEVVAVVVEAREYGRARPRI
jgi:hypothetical protein